MAKIASVENKKAPSLGSLSRPVGRGWGRPFFFLFLLSLTSFAQAPAFQVNKAGKVSSEVWQAFADVKFQLRDDFYHPQFGSKIKALSGKTVEVAGYLFPLEETRWSKHFALSSLPLNACFFCGVGGPETVVEVEARVPVKQTEKPLRLRGTLVLNSTDTEKMIYILKNAEPVE